MFEEAENFLRESIAKLPDSPHFHYALGVVMGKLKRFKVYMLVLLTIVVECIIMAVLKLTVRHGVQLQPGVPNFGLRAGM